MNVLVGKALDEDDDFWGGIGGDFFGTKKNKKTGSSDGEAQKDSDDEDFDLSDDGLEADGEDSFDSDFGKSEEE